MSIQSHLSGRFNVIVDGRSAKRDAGVPESVEARSSYMVGNRAKQIDILLNADEMPVAFVDGDATIWLLTAGASGVVAFESTDERPLTDAQGDAVDAVVDALHKEFKIKKVKKKQKEELPKAEDFPFQWPDIIADVNQEEADATVEASS